MRRNWLDAPIVFTHRPACPHCWRRDRVLCEDFIQADQEPQGDDGSILRKLVCKRCSKPVRNAEESFPFQESGILVDWLGYVPPNDDVPS